MKTLNIAFFCITALVSFNNYAQADGVQKKKWVVQERQPSDWDAFLKNYGFKSAIGGITGASCGVGCALAEKKFNHDDVKLLYWFISWVVKSGLVSKITNEMKEHGIEDKNRLVGKSALLSTWISYILLKLVY